MNRELTNNFALLKETWTLWVKQLNWLISSAGILAIQFIGQMFIGVIYLVLLFPSMMFMDDPSSMGPVFGGFIIGFIVVYIILIIYGVYTTLGYTYLSLDMVKSGKAHIENVFKGYKWLGRGLLAMLLFVLLVFAVSIPSLGILIGVGVFIDSTVFVVIGVLLFYLLLILVFLPFAQVYNVMVDQGKKTIDSFKESVRLMKGAKLKYLGFILIIMLITLIPTLLMTVPIIFMVLGEAIIAAAGSLIIIAGASMLLMPLLYSFSMTASAKFYYDLLDDDEPSLDDTLAIEENNSYLIEQQETEE
ncbi:glycerophosphoryl diester phosphodiesterase membrane domain-containing protein [Vallitalea okinawensis]|uniref:glycerophosphoryl diester phosphodiesterase membrane domain-containing protein n=1 Tax=Vallitalea okinawensis TaxID=2078660 RepID=UPI000CFE10C8|nr:glycerophosphoryl diester phosphodiesterase membrane domain-containing protein [Vallitalea okinawensis]